jgi:hypothetical protein
MKAEEPTHEDCIRNVNNVTGFDRLSLRTQRASSIFFSIEKKNKKMREGLAHLFADD